MNKYVFILEDEKKFQKEITDAILNTNSQIRIRIFESLEAFSNWIKVLIEKGAPAINLAGKSIEGQPEPAESQDGGSLLLLVSKEEFLGSHQMELLKKTHQLFLRKGLCTEQEPTSFVLTSFDHSQFDIKLVEGRLINNVIMKPFDQLILQQHLCFAMSGHHPPSAYTIQNMKMDAVVEMLKDVQVESLSEVGFITRSQREIPVGHLAKYYSDIFKSASTRSVLARSHQVAPHPKYQGEYLCSFVFYGIEEGQRIDIASRILGKGLPREGHSWILPCSEKGFHLVMIDGEDFTEELRVVYTEEVMNGHFYPYSRVEDFLYDLDPAERLLKQKGIKAVPVDAGMKLIFDEDGQKILKTDPELTPGQHLLGFKLDELRAIKLIDLIDGNAAKNIFQKFLSGDTVYPQEERIFSIHRNQQEYIFKVDHQEIKELPYKQRVNELLLREVSDVEKLNLWKKKSSLPQHIDAVLVRDHHYEADVPRWQKVQEALQRRQKTACKIFLNAYKKKTEKNLRDFENHFLNIFFRSKEKLYLIHQLSVYFSNMKLKTNYEIETITHPQVIEVGNPIHVKELSEAGLVLEYNRAIDLGEFRKFVLWRPEETDMPTFLAICNYFEENKSKKGFFSNHFVFYGLNDSYLKHLRLWLLNNYIQNKEKE